MSRQFHRPARLDPEAAESLLVSQDTALSSQLAHHTAQLVLGTAGTDDPAGTEGSAGPAGADLLTRQGVLAVVARHGVDDVAEMWASSPATTLPGTLWRLFLVREWIRRDPALVERRYATTVDLTAGGTREPDQEEADRLEAALAQGRAVPGPEQVRGRIDAALEGWLADQQAAGGLPDAAPAGSPAAPVGDPDSAPAGTLAGAAAAGPTVLTRLADLLEEVAWFLRALAAGSRPAWIEDDDDALASPVTRRDSALVDTAVELEEAARRAAAGTLD